MDCEGEVIPPGQVINILQKKGENAKNAKKLLIICPGWITSPSQFIVYYNFRKKAITFTCDFSYVIITKVQFYAVFVFISVHVTCFILKGFILDPNLFLPIINTHNKKKHPMRNSAGCFFPYIKYSLPLKRPQVEELPYD